MKKYKSLMVATAIALFASASYTGDVAAMQPTIESPSNVLLDGFMEPVVKGQLASSKAVAAKSTTTVGNVDELEVLLTDNFRAFNDNFTLTVNEHLSMTELTKLVEKAYKRDGYVHGTIDRVNYSLMNDNGKATVKLAVSYRHTLAQEEIVTQKIKDITASIIRPSMSDTDKLKAIYDYVALQSTYTENTMNSPHSPYTLLTEHGGVCQAYALVAYRLLAEAGFENYFVTGDGLQGTESIPHAWNLVNVDGALYHYDTTWADPVFAVGKAVYEDYLNYSYFLVSDKTIRMDHRIDEGYPTAASDDYVPGLATINSTVVNYTMKDQTYALINVPTYHNGSWYYTNEDYALTKWHDGAATVITPDERAFSTVYANNQIFFLNNELQLYAYDLTIGKIVQKTTELASRIRIEGDKLVAYDGKHRVYEELLTAASNDVMTQVTMLLNNLFVPNFEQQTTALLADFSALSEAQKATLPSSVKTAIIDVEGKLQQLQTFNTSLQAKESWEKGPATTSNPRKPWTVTLSKELENTNANKANIRVQDMFGQELDVETDIHGKQLTIMPLGEYKPDVPYTLVINKALKSIDGKSLKKDIYMKFTFEK